MAVTHKLNPEDAKGLIDVQTSKGKNIGKFFGTAGIGAAVAGSIAGHKGVALGGLAASVYGGALALTSHLSGKAAKKKVDKQTKKGKSLVINDKIWGRGATWEKNAKFRFALNIPKKMPKHVNVGRRTMTPEVQDYVRGKGPLPSYGKENINALQTTHALSSKGSTEELKALRGLSAQWSKQDHNKTKKLVERYKKM